MTKKFSKLKKAEQEKIEHQYHLMKPEDFDDLMTRGDRPEPMSDMLQLVDANQTLKSGGSTS